MSREDKRALALALTALAVLGVGAFIAGWYGWRWVT